MLVSTYHALWQVLGVPDAPQCESPGRRRFPCQPPIAFGEQGVDPVNVFPLLTDFDDHTRNGSHHPRQKSVGSNADLDQLPACISPPGRDRLHVPEENRAIRASLCIAPLRPRNSIATAGKRRKIVRADQFGNAIPHRIDVERPVALPRYIPHQRLPRA